MKKKEVNKMKKKIWHDKYGQVQCNIPRELLDDFDKPEAFKNE